MRSLTMSVKHMFGVLACLAAVLPGAAFAEQYVGLIYPQHDLTLSMGAGGVISHVRVKPGQRVRADEVLLVLDDRMQAIEVDRRKVVAEDRAELRATEERVRALKTMYDDTRKVYETTGSISRDEFFKLEVEYSSARARLEQLEAQERRERLEYEGAVRELQMRRLTAPVSGVITKIEAKVGEWAKPGEALIALVDSSVCYLKTNIPLAAAQRLQVGAVVPIRVEGASDATAMVQAKVTFISAIADPASGLVELRLTFANPGQRIRPGIKGSISIPTGIAG